MTPLLVALGGGAGALARYVLATRYDTERLPRATLAINVVGSFLLGLLVGLEVGGDAMALLGTGFCGGFTTYSAFAVQTHRLGAVRGAAYAVATVLPALAACALGYLLGQA